jgi:hypothetical protein
LGFGVVSDLFRVRRGAFRWRHGHQVGMRRDVRLDDCLRSGYR